MVGIALVLAVAAAAAGLADPRLAPRFERAVARFAAAAARGVQRGLFTVVHAVAVLPAWAVARVLGARPLGAHGGWHDVPRPAGSVVRAEARRPSADRPRDPAGRTPRFRLAAVAVVAVAGVAAYQVARPEPRPEIVGLGFWAPAYPGQDWAEPLFDEMADYPLPTDPFTGVRGPDHEGRFTVRDGIRSSYEVADPELVVWFFGGSSMFGLGQRDEHTIPSAFARAAEADGHRVSVVNFGVNTWASWQEADAFAQRLDTLPDPDLVVFYDGVNDWSVVDALIASGRPTDRPWAIGAGVPPGGEPTLGGPATGDLARRPALAGYAAAMGRAAETVDALAARRGIGVHRYWQPSAQSTRFTGEAATVLPRLGFDAAAQPPLRAEYLALREMIEPAPVDLTDTFDGLAQPVLWDWVHTNELGAQLVASRIYQDLLPAIEERNP